MSFELKTHSANVAAYQAEQAPYLLQLYSAQWPGDTSSLLTAKETSSLFRYIAGLVLPKVEREPKGSPRAHMPWWTADGLRVHAVVGAHGGRGIEVEDHDDLTPTQARALAACLLAAADEAEGESPNA